ncbi:YchF-related putative GTPase [Ferroplasma acidiphilum]|uniref:YchF-related putative GTPase n=1 Tax=Ferroplasma acidiphilum TaxID=74969 RepID=UPI0023F11591|nr:YchF-related putative GTPase [Ferroplasma acidiphilum]
MLKIGLIGKPNAGKSTLFSAITSIDVDIANYPFTTIKPNVGISFVKDKCPENEINAKCNPREGKCLDGIRYIPVEIIDVPGLIEGASEGKGMGNEFLDNIRDADLIINLFDASGMTDMEGNPSESSHDPLDDIKFVNNEIISWMNGKISKDWQKFARKEDNSPERLDVKILQKAATFGLSEKDVSFIMTKESFPDKLIHWTDNDINRFSEAILKYVKPVFSIGNKLDLLTGDAIKALKDRENKLYMISAEYELLIEKAYNNGYISSDAIDFTFTDKSGEAQKTVLNRIKEKYRNGEIMRFYDVLTSIIKSLGYIVVYPVLDETKWEDKNGNVLPDAYLMKDGDTALDMAYKIHTDIGKNFIRAVNGRTKRVIGKDYKLLNNDVIKIISNSR